MASGGKRKPLLPYQRDRIEAANRAARRSRCKRCGEPLLVGLDADHVAASVRVDVQPVDRVGEVAALLTGRRTYNFIRGNLYIREPHHTGLMQYENQPELIKENEHEPEQPIYVTHICAG